MRPLNAFTLFELLVAVTVIAVLVSMLLVALPMVRNQAYQVRCLAHLRQLPMAQLAFAADNNGLSVPVMEDMSTPLYVDWNRSWWLLLQRYTGERQDDGVKDTGDKNKVGQGIFQGCPAFKETLNRFGWDRGSNGYALNDKPGLPGNGHTNARWSENATWGRRFRMAQITYGDQRGFVLDADDTGYGALASRYHRYYWNGSWNDTVKIQQRHHGGPNVAFFSGRAQKVATPEVRVWKGRDAIFSKQIMEETGNGSWEWYLETDTPLWKTRADPAQGTL
jgi:prepilin-type N-terminal cleavage/methylation domain-containing protein